MCPYASHIPEPPLAAVQIEAEEASSGTCMTPSMPTVRHAGHDGVASRMAFREPGREHDDEGKQEGSYGLIPCVQEETELLPAEHGAPVLPRPGLGQLAVVTHHARLAASSG